MATYRVVFVNGEKRELTVDADTFQKENGEYLFLKSGKAVASSPVGQVLYVEKVAE